MISATCPPEVLIADDESIGRCVLQIYLESLGFRTIAAKDGNEALAIFRGAPGRIGFVILDICMPGPPPVELYNLLRQTNPSVPVLYCSGISSDDPVSRAIDAHGLHLLTKPFNRGDLYEAIRQITRGAALEAVAQRCLSQDDVSRGIKEEWIVSTSMSRSQPW